jgi:hypothetical protein
MSSFQGEDSVRTVFDPGVELTFAAACKRSRNPPLRCTLRASALRRVSASVQISAL